MTRIKDIRLKAIKDSRGQATLEAHFLNDNFAVSASVPQGASTGSREAVSLPAQKALEKFNHIKQKILKENFSGQKEFDQFLCRLDETKNKSYLGANLTLALSLCFCRFQAREQNLPLYQYLAKISGALPKLPAFYMNLINGGKHAHNNLDFQEYMVVVSATSAQEQLKIGQDIFAAIKDDLRQRKKNFTYGDEGGYDTSFDNNEQPFQVLGKVIKSLGYEDRVRLAIDAAANSFYQPENQSYCLFSKAISPEALLKIYENFSVTYNLLSIEDPFEENSFKYYATLKHRLAQEQTFIIGDDLTTTRIDSIKEALRQKAISGIIIKPNQIGTLSETLAAITLAQKNRLKVVVSHRSGETMDSFIADLAFAVGAFGFKAGAPSAPERLVKYQRILEITSKKNF